MRRADMLHLDRNQHPATLSPPLILHNSNSDQHQILSWSAISRDSVLKDKDKSATLQNLETSPASTLTPPPENPSEPSPRQDNHTLVPDSKVDSSSRQSTPLSELSSPSPSDHAGSPEQDKRDKGREKEEQGENTQALPVGSASEADNEFTMGKDGQSAEDSSSSRTTQTTKNATTTDLPSLSTVTSPPKQADPKHLPTAPLNMSSHISRNFTAEGSLAQLSESLASSLPPVFAKLPSVISPIGSLSTTKLDTKVVTILELNAELLKAAMEFQSRGIPMADPRFNQFSVRMQSNLAWMAAAADANRESMTMALPVMQPPTSVDFLSMDRIYRLYATLPTIFANDISRRNQPTGSPGAGVARSVSPIISLKRDRNDESSLDLVNKRRDTGETKISSLPSVPLNNNQAPFHSIAPSISPPAAMQPSQQPIASSSMPPPSQIPSMSSHVPDSRQQNQPMRPVPPQHQTPQNFQSNFRQTSPSATTHPGMPGSIPSNPAGPSNHTVNGNPVQTAGLNSLGPLAVQYYNILQNPSHPMVQYLANSVPGFQSMPVQAQITKLHQMQTALQRNQQQMAAQRIGQQGSGVSQQINQFPNPNTSMNPLNPSSNAHQSPMSAQSPQIQSSFSNGGVNPPIDARMGAQNVSAHQQTVVPNLNNLTLNQRQLLMMQQQMRGNGVNNSPVNPAMLNSQIAAAQGRMRQEQQHRISPGAGSPSHSQSSIGGSGIEGGQYPMMRSNSTVQGIARSGRSPTDSSSIQVRLPSGSQQSPEDMQRAILAQQQRSMMGQGSTPAYVNPQQMFSGSGSNWSQQSGGGLGGQQQGYGMSPAPSTGIQGGGYGLSSPNPQQWGGQGSTNMQQYPYNAASSPLVDRTSATPTPSQQISHSPPAMMDPSSSLGDFDLFNWAAH